MNCLHYKSLATLDWTHWTLKTSVAKVKVIASNLPQLGLRTEIMAGWQKRHNKRERERKRTRNIEEMDGFCDLEECSESCMITEQLFTLGWRSCVWAVTLSGLRDFFFALHSSKQQASIVCDRQRKTRTMHTCSCMSCYSENTWEEECAFVGF